MADMNLAEMIDSQAAGIVKAMQMPKVEVTTVEKERIKKESKRVFKTRVFLILDDYSGESYSEFINMLMRNTKTCTVLRELENWTKDGELIRVVDFVEEEPN